MQDLCRLVWCYFRCLLPELLPSYGNSGCHWIRWGLSEAGASDPGSDTLAVIAQIGLVALGDIQLQTSPMDVGVVLLSKQLAVHVLIHVAYIQGICLHAQGKNGLAPVGLCLVLCL